MNTFKLSDEAHAAVIYYYDYLKHHYFCDLVLVGIVHDYLNI